MNTIKHLIIAVASLASAGVFAEGGITNPAASAAVGDVLDNRDTPLRTAHFTALPSTNEISVFAGVEYITLSGKKDDKGLFDSGETFVQIGGKIPFNQIVDTYTKGYLHLSLYAQKAFVVTNSKVADTSLGKIDADSFAKASVIGVMMSPELLMTSNLFVRADIDAQMSYNSDDNVADSRSFNRSLVVGAKRETVSTYLRGEIGYGHFERFVGDENRSLMRVIAALDAPLLKLTGRAVISVEVNGLGHNEGAESRVNIGYEITFPGDSKASDSSHK